MKHIVTLITLSFLFISCEEVIDLSLDTQEKQLVIDASIDWLKGETTATPTVHLSFTNDYYNDLPSEAVSGANIFITTYFGERYQLKEVRQQENNGSFIGGGSPPKPSPVLYPQQGGTLYICEDKFIPELGKDYILNIDYQGVTYTSKARMREVPNLDPARVVQNDNGGILKDEIELRFYFDGIQNEQNVYLAQIPDHNRDLFLTLDDRFFANGKFFFSTAQRELLLNKNDKIKVRLHRISADYKQIVDLMKQANGSANAGPPVGSIPKRVLGNIINEKDPTKNPLGAFRVSQYTEAEYVIK